MSCGCNKGIKPAQEKKIEAKPLKNLFDAANTQQNKLKWIFDGAKKLYLCLEGKIIYTDDQIRDHRRICGECEYSTKNENGKLNLTSQCMAINPETGEKCGCVLLCKTSVDEKGCPLKKWPVKLSIERKEF